ncbi:Arylsulfatase B [Papilio xuthus]|uniref:Arylsulfatase B n=1 Tax=Papilio xuthus TaxID=66420 RepID=A0A194PE98_PAPXU|nr:Arylsulfatase B [Papilio xuthus]
MFGWIDGCLFEVRKGPCDTLKKIEKRALVSYPNLVWLGQIFLMRLGDLYVILLVMILMSDVHKVEGEWKRPNIVFIIADDMGYDDVSFHGSDQIMTPNIDLLAYTGVALERYYSHAACTPSRSALLTGKYAHVTGMQGYPLTNSEDRGLPVTEKIMPQYFKELGYATHLVGKWHVGQSRTEFLPTMRGFDTHFGHRGGFIDYYEYTLQEENGVEEVTGFGLFRNLSAAWNDEGYITDLYTKEAKSIIMGHNDSQPLFLVVAHNAPHSANAAAVLQAPPEAVRSMRHIESPQRRIYAGMVKRLDESVGEIVKALLEKNIIDNTIIVFVSDNGGMTSGDSINYASNWPLRGLKMSPFEGGIRVNGLIWSQNLTEDSHSWKGYFHVSDWLPTLMRAAGADPPLGIDGFDLWDNIIKNKPSKRTEIYEFDDMGGHYTIFFNEYKLVTGHVPTEFGDYQGGEELKSIIGNGPDYNDTLQNSVMHDVLCSIGKQFDFEKAKLRDKLKLTCHEDVKKNPHLCFPQNTLWCLYNVIEDPCETENLSKNNYRFIRSMLNRLQKEIARSIPRQKVKRDPRSSPRLHNYTWDVWADDNNPSLLRS